MLNMRQKIALSGEVGRRYRSKSKKEKSKILDEFVQNTGYNRSYARRILGNLKTRGRKRKHILRKRIYDASVFYPLKTLWIAADNICGKRLKPFIPELLRILIRDKNLRVNKKERAKLETVSASTIDRMLAHVKKSYQLKGRSTTKPGTLLRSTIPIKMFSDWDEKRPGFFEADLVALCGDSVRGDYVNALNLTDVATGWEGLEAFMGKGQYRTEKAVNIIRSRLPFPLLGIDSDNGVEFINWLLKAYCEKNNISFTRIRPYRKNDNCYVEQKNYTVPRGFIGYARFDTDEQLIIIQDILKLVEPYVNFFMPSKKLLSKEVVGNKTKKKYNAAKTPYQRLIESNILNEAEKQKLQEVYETLNPLSLRRQIGKLTDKLMKTLRYKINDLTNI